MKKIPTDGITFLEPLSGGTYSSCPTARSGCWAENKEA